MFYIKYLGGAALEGQENLPIFGIILRGSYATARTCPWRSLITILNSFSSPEQVTVGCDRGKCKPVSK